MPHIIVAGAGIGGLCAAIAIRRQGFAVTILEKQPSPREVGAGLGLWVNAVRALKRIGVGDLVESIAVPDGAGGFFDDRGRLLAIVSARTFLERFGAPSFSYTAPSSWIVSGDVAMPRYAGTPPYPGFARRTMGSRSHAPTVTNSRRTC